MTSDDLFRLVAQLQRHEDGQHVHGSRFRLFKDTQGNWTIGWGRNIGARGISEEEADFLLGNDINDAQHDLSRVFPWFQRLDSVRQCAMVEFGFIGIEKLLGFEKALRAMAVGDYATAADEFYDSNLPKPGQWGPQRTARVCAMIRTGAWQ